MSDYNEMRKYLDGLSQDKFELLISEFCGVELMKVDDNQWKEVLLETGGTHHVPPHNWREKRTKTLLAHKENNKPEWNRLCYYARIDSDSASQLKLARRALYASLFAILISVGSIVVSIILYNR